MGRDVFISYSSRDKACADAVCHHLEAEGLRCWIAPRDMPSGTWGKPIVEAIKGSRVLVVVFSSNANGSVQVLREVERAVNYRCMIIPFRIEDVTPRDDLEYFLSAVHWLDAMTPPLERHIQALVLRVKATLAAEDEASQVEQGAPAAGKPVRPAGTMARPEGRLAPILRVWNRLDQPRVIALAALGVLPLVADLVLRLDLAPPWPEHGGAALLTVLANVVAFSLAWSLTGEAGARSLRRGVIACAVLASVFLATYLTLRAALVWETLTPHESVVGGFVLTPQIRRLRQEMPEQTIQDLLRGYEYETKNVWEAWSIVLASVGLLGSWLMFCVSLAALVALLLKLVRSRGREALPGAPLAAGA